MQLSIPAIQELEQHLLSEGIAQVGYSKPGDTLPERYRHLPYAITLVYKLSDAVIDEILTQAEPPRPTFSYFQHYRAVNAFLDSKTLWITAMLERLGALALPVAASQSVKDMGPYSGVFPHKTAAVLAGLGWIGKSALFVSPQFGPRVRLATVLTDYPLPLSDHKIYRAAELACAVSRPAPPPPSPANRIPRAAAGLICSIRRPAANI